MKEKAKRFVFYDEPIAKKELWQQVSKTELRASLDDLRLFKTLEERGYGNLLLDLRGLFPFLLVQLGHSFAGGLVKSGQFFA